MGNADFAPSADVIVIGAGLIGLALARDLRARGLRPLVLEAGRAGREASWAGAGMLAAYRTSDMALRPLAVAAARLYPGWVAELEHETGMNTGYRESGTLFLASPGHPAPSPALEGWEPMTGEAVAELEPELRFAGDVWRIAGDHCVDNRALSAALAESLRRSGVEVRERARVTAVRAAGGGLTVETPAGRMAAAVVVNCAGAWAGGFDAPAAAEVRPRKGQMFALRHAPDVRHVIAGERVYLVPRGGGRVLVGATLEDCGFDASVSQEMLAGLRQRAEALVPGLARAEMEEAWAGFRPGTPDERPLIGETSRRGYWMATGHFRDGILLAPLTAKIVASAIAKGHLTKALDLRAFAPERF